MARKVHLPPERARVIQMGIGQRCSVATAHLVLIPRASTVLPDTVIYDGSTKEDAMGEPTQFEALVENARLDYVAASDRRDPAAYELFQNYWMLLRDYNLAWTQDATEHLYLDRAGDEAGVLMRVVDEEYNEAGLMPKYFADRLREANLGRPPTEGDVWQIVASDQYRETHWVSSRPLRSHLAEIEELTTVKEPEMDMAPVTVANQIDEISVEDESEEPSPVVKGRRDVAAEVTQRIIDQLEAGTVPWHKPWASTGGQLPVSLSTGRPYRGTNSLLLGMSAMSHGYASPLWGTFHQIKELGGVVNKGEHGTMVIIYKPFVKESTNAAGETVEERKGALLRSYTVFNLAQTSGLEHLLTIALDPRTEHERIAECETAVQGYLNNGGPRLAHDGGARAYYSPSDDRVAIPELEMFATPEGYYSTLFHELTHSTGHATRLNRGEDLGNHSFGSPCYAKEELCAELGAAMSCASLGIDQTATIPQSAAYIENWLGVLRNDRSLVLKASASAQKAVELMGLDMGREVSLNEERSPEVGDREREVVPSDVGGAEPELAIATLDERTATIRQLELYVSRAKSEAASPELFAQHPITDEMCRLRQQLDVAVARGDETHGILDALGACQRKIDSLTGATANIIAREHLISAATAEHVNDAEKLEAEMAGLSTYRESMLTEVASFAPAWQISIDERYGPDGLIRTAEWCERHQVPLQDLTDPFGAGEMTEEQAVAREDLLLSLGFSISYRGHDLAR